VKVDEALLKQTEHALNRCTHASREKRVVDSDLDDAIATRASVNASLCIAREQLQLLISGARPEVLEQAEAKLQAAEAHLQLDNP